jgi:glucose/arabinose dehydrogenase
MKRAFVFSAALLCSLALASASFAQTAQAAKPATPTGTAAPAAKAKFAPLVKGVAKIEVIQGMPKKVGTDMVTVTKIKNVSDGAIGLLRVDEYWYDKNLKEVSGDTEKVRQPLMPGEVVEVTTKSPIKPNLYKSQIQFSHANGKIDAKPVKKFAGQ